MFDISHYTDVIQADYIPYKKIEKNIEISMFSHFLYF